MQYLGVFANLEGAQKALAAALADANLGKINLVTPGREVSFLPPMRALAQRRLDVHPDQLYALPGSRNQALGRTFLEALAKTMRIEDVGSERTDDYREPCVCSFRVTVKLPLLDGGFAHYMGEKTVDLRDGSPGADDALGRSKSAASLAVARKFIAELCQTKARLRAYRTAMSILGGLDGSAQARPWVCVSLVPWFDASMVSQDVLDLAAAQTLGLDPVMLFGRPRTVPAPAVPGAPPRLAAPDGGPAPRRLPPPPDDDPPTVPEETPGPPVEADPAKATPQQLKDLRGYFDSLGEAAFRAIAAEGLGRPLPPSTELSGADADTILAHVEAAFRPGF